MSKIIVMVALVLVSMSQRAHAEIGVERFSTARGDGIIATFSDADVADYDLITQALQTMGTLPNVQYGCSNGACSIQIDRRSGLYEEESKYIDGRFVLQLTNNKNLVLALRNEILKSCHSKLNFGIFYAEQFSVGGGVHDGGSPDYLTKIIGTTNGFRGVRSQNGNIFCNAANLSSTYPVCAINAAGFVLPTDSRGTITTDIPKLNTVYISSTVPVEDNCTK